MSRVTVEPSSHLVRSTGKRWRLWLTMRWLAVEQFILARWDRRTARGDVPGWVLITVMSASVVGVLLLAAKTQLPAMFNNALQSVTP